MNCTFETDFCGYFQDTKDDFDWTRTNQASPTRGTGPDRDHTTGTGRSQYIVLAYKDYISPRNEHLKLLNRIKFLNLFLYNSN